MRTICHFFVGLIACTVASSTLHAQSETLTLLVSNSDFVALATYTGTQGAFRSNGTWATENFAIAKILAGKSTLKTVQVAFTRDNLDPMLPLKVGQQVILFLKYRHEQWEPTDRFLGCQDDTHGLEKAVEEVGATPHP